MYTDYKNDPSVHGRNSHLHRLGELADYRVTAEDPDVRGWMVRSSDNQPIGHVEELIVDTQAEKVRYLVVDVHTNYAADSKDHYMLVPIGAAQIDNSGDSVQLNNISSANSMNYPVYRGEQISREYENSIRRFYESGGTAPQGSEIIRDAHTGKSYYTSDASQRPTPTNRASDSHQGGLDSHLGPSAAIASGSNIPREQDAPSTPVGRTPDAHHISDLTQADSNTISSSWEPSGRDVSGQRNIGTSNLSGGADALDRSRRHGIPDNRTSGLENKNLDTPKGNSPEITDRYGRPVEHTISDPKTSASTYKRTSNLGSSTSLGSQREGVEAEKLKGSPKAAGPHDRGPAPSPNDIKDEAYYSNDPNYDDSRFYSARRKKD